MLKKIKEPPLLNPPSPDEALLQPTPEEEKWMDAALDFHRRKMQGIMLGSMHVWMRGIGLKTHLKKDDKRLIEMELDKSRDPVLGGLLRRGGLGIAQASFLLHKLGIGTVKIGGVDEIFLVLEHERDRTYDKKSGLELARLDYHICRGEQAHIPERDASLIRSTIEKLKNGDGETGELAEILFLARSLDLNVEVTDKDKKAMLGDFKEQRAKLGIEKRTETLYYLSQLFPQTKDKHTQPLPPIRKFGGLT